MNPENVETFLVTFVDWDGTVIDEQTVELGSAAIAPADPVRTGYTFTGWDADFSNVTDDMFVTAQYKIKTYTVIFMVDDVVFNSQIIEHGSKVAYPGIPTKAGHTFTGWDKDYSDVTGDLTVNAQFKINEYTVTFVDWNGEVLKKHTVPYGANATAPADPAREGYVFTGWDKDFSSIASDLTVTALYIINPSAVEFVGFTRLVRVYPSTMTYSEIQNDIKGSTPDFTLTTVGGTNINANGMTNRNAVEVKIDGVNGQNLYISTINTAGTESYRVPLKETAPGSGIYAPTNLVSYSFPASLIAPTPPVYKILVYAGDAVIGSLSVTVVNTPPVVTPTVVEFTRLVRVYPATMTYSEIQNDILGVAPDFTLTTVGTTNINANGMTNRNSVEVKIDGLSGQDVYIVNVNNQGVESPNRIKMKETAPGSGIYAPTSLVSYSFNASLLFQPTYKLNIYVDGVTDPIGSLTVTVVN